MTDKHYEGKLTFVKGKEKVSVEYDCCRIDAQGDKHPIKGFNENPVNAFMYVTMVSAGINLLERSPSGKKLTMIIEGEE